MGEFMDDIKFSDNMKEFRKRFILLIIVLPVAVASIVVNVMKNGSEIIDAKTIALLCILGLVVLNAIYTFTYISTYSVTIQDNILKVTQLGVKKSFELREGMMYSYKKIVSGYYLIKIKTEEHKISVRTKKPKELVDILLTYDIKLEEN